MRWPLRIALTLVLLLGLLFTQQQWRYQHAVAHKHLQRATQIWPANDRGWYLLAAQTQFTDFDASARAAQQAVNANPNDWQNWGMLAEAQLEQGNMSAARQSMQSMARHATGFAAHWQYANLLLLSGDTAGFWPQAIEALSFAPDGQILPALHQMWRFAQGDTAQFNDAIAAAARRAPDVQQPARLDIAAVQFYLQQQEQQLAAASAPPARQHAESARNRSPRSQQPKPGHTGRPQPGAATGSTTSKSTEPLDAVAPWWQRALRDPHSDPADLRLFGNQYLAILADAGNTATAHQVWHEGLQKRFFNPDDGPSASNLIASGGEGALAWQLCTACGPWPANEAGTLTFTFHGNQADLLTLASQRLLLDPAHAYQLSFHQTAEAGGLTPNDSGTSAVQVEIIGPHNALLQQGAGTFTMPDKPIACDLKVIYQRPQGQIPFSGTVTIANLSLTPHAPLATPIQ